MTDQIREAFDRIKADDALKKSVEEYIVLERRKRSQHNHQALFWKVLAGVCLTVILTVGIRGYLWFRMPVSFVSIEVNPSLELGLNPLDRVVSATAYNEAGEEVLNELQLKGEELINAIDAIMGSGAMQACLDDGSEVIFTVAAAKGREKELKSGVEYCMGRMEYSSKSISVDVGIASQAHENGLPLGKYYAYLLLLQYDDTVTIEDCKKMSMSDIQERIREHEQASQEPETENEGGEEILQPETESEEETIEQETIEQETENGNGEESQDAELENGDGEGNQDVELENGNGGGILEPENGNGWIDDSGTGYGNGNGQGWDQYQNGSSTGYVDPNAGQVNSGGNGRHHQEQYHE